MAENAIDDFELERGPGNAQVPNAVQRALEEVGIVFLPQDDVRLGSEAA